MDLQGRSRDCFIVEGSCIQFDTIIGLISILVYKLHVMSNRCSNETRVCLFMHWKLTTNINVFINILLDHSNKIAHA